MSSPLPSCPHEKTYPSTQHQGEDVCYRCGSVIPRDAVPPTVPIDPGDASIQAKFIAFHLRNPKVYEGLVVLARRGKAAGRGSLGMKMLYEVLRWEWTLEGLPDSAEAWKLPNDYTSRYARMIMTVEDDLNDLFETRSLRTP